MTQTEQIEQIEQAIATLEQQRAVLGDAVVDASLASLRETLAALRARAAEEQRKYITVLFADVVGSTQLGERLDPEDLLAVMNGALQRCRAMIERHDGRVMRFMGDGLLAVFGVPNVREDDAERAVRAGLAIREAARDYALDVEERWGIRGFAMRVGINSGLVVLGGGEEEGQTLTGDAVNLAARMESAAPPGEVLISHDTYRHVRGLFDVQPLDPIAVKGKSRPVQVYTVERAKPRAFRMPTRGVEGIETNTIGRKTELLALQAAYRAVADGRGVRLITITGDAGVGKTRLLYDFENWAELLPEFVLYFKGRATPETLNLPSGLLRDLFSYRFDIRDSDSLQVVQEKVRAGMAPQVGPDQAAVLGQLVGFDFSDVPAVQASLADPQFDQLAVASLTTYFRHLAESAPVLLLLEDIHWADDRSLNLIERLLANLRDARVLCVGLARHALYERRPDWGTGNEHLKLAPLSIDDSRTLVAEILQQADDIPETMRELIVQSAEGNPFYIEELIKMLIDQGVIVRGNAPEDRWQVQAGWLESLDVPPTLVEVLQARLDGLSPDEKAALQRAAVVGRTFWDVAVAYLGDSRADAGQSAPLPLQGLRDRELVFQHERSSFDGSEEYVFKHALLRDVTYESVLRRLRARYHALAAEWLILTSGPRADEYADVIAGHWAIAGERAREAEWQGRAGMRAAAHFANADALRSLGRALELTPDDEVDRRYELVLTREEVYDRQGARAPQADDLAALDILAAALGDAIRQAEVARRQLRYRLNTGDYTGAEQAAEHALRLAQAVGDVRTQASVQQIHCRLLRHQARYPEARQQGEQALGLAREGGFTDIEAESLNELGIVADLTGDRSAAKEYFEQSAAAWRRAGRRTREGAAINNLGIVAWRQGDYAAAQRYFEQSLRIDQEIGDRHSEGLTLGNLAMLARAHGNPAQAQKYAEQALQVQRETGNRYGESRTLAILGSALLDQGHLVAARDAYQAAVDLDRATGDQQDEASTLVQLGFVSIRLGQHAAARTDLDAALALARQIGDRDAEMGALRNRSLLHDYLNEMDAALRFAKESLEIAEDIGGPEDLAFALSYLGHANVARGELNEAAHAYRRAWELRDGNGPPGPSLEPRGGLARVLLAQGDLPAALEHVEGILTALGGASTPDMDEAARVALICYQVLQAANDRRALEVLTRAHSELQAQAAELDESTRHDFLEMVPHHRELMAAWQSAAQS